MPEFDVRKVGGRIGAEAVGVNVRELAEHGAGPPGPPGSEGSGGSGSVLAEIKSALLEHKALAFRGQELTDRDQIAFASLLGPLTGAHPTVPSVEGQPQILPVDGEDGIRANHWHTDVTFVRTPPKASTLRSLVVPPYGGNTLIANSATAYQDLPAELREFADRLWAVHTNVYDYARPSSDIAPDKLEEYRRVFASKKYRTAHPVVRVHPESGERGLFIGGFAQQIVGLSGSESRAILDLFQAYVTRPENIFRWQWAPGDLVLFANRITQHYAPDDYGDLPRRLHRVTVAGDAPVGVEGKESYIIEGDDASHYTPTAAA